MDDLETLELVVWRDAHFSLDDDRDQDDYLVRTVGWVSEDGRFLRVESERLPDDDGARAVSRIPLGMVVERFPLTFGPTYGEDVSPQTGAKPQEGRF